MAGSAAGSGSADLSLGSGAGSGSGSAAPPEEESGGFVKWLGFPPLGSYMYATSVAEIGVTMGSFPGAGGFGTGFHYAERGALFSTWILAILGSAAERQAAQDRANATGTTQYYRQYSPADFGRTGMTIDAYSTQLGGNVSGILFDLFIVRRFKEESHLPWCLDVGLTFYGINGPDTMKADPNNPTSMITDKHEVFGLGMVFGLLIPASKWAQVEIKARPVLGSPTYMTYEAEGTVNVGNKLYARGSFVGDIKSGKGFIFGFGGRL